MNVTIIATQGLCPVCRTTLVVIAPVRVTRHVVQAPARCPSCGLRVEVRWRSDRLDRLDERRENPCRSW